DYMVDINRVVLRPRRTHAAPSNNDLDRSTWAIRAPVAYPRDWLAMVKVRSVREEVRTGQTGVVIDAETIPNHPQYTVPMHARLMLFCDASKRHLPTHAEVFGEDGSLEEATDIEYQRVGGKPTWLVKTATIWAWPDGMVTTPDIAKATSRQVFAVEGEIRIDDPVHSDRFNPQLPGGTWVGDASRGGRTSGFLTKPTADTKELFDRLPPPAPVSEE